MTVKQLIHVNTNGKNPTYITFIHFTKAYDKAWLDAVMYDMNKEGIYRQGLSCYTTHASNLS